MRGTPHRELYRQHLAGLAAGSRMALYEWSTLLFGNVLAPRGFFGIVVVPKAIVFLFIGLSLSRRRR
jgi:hypothetical protein